MDELEFYNRHYIAVDERGRITDGFSDAFGQPAATDICINEHGGYQFRLYPNGVENPYLLDGDGIPLYKWDGYAVVPRTAEEIAADREALPAQEEPPTQLDRIEAQVTYTAMITDTLLEV